MKKFDLVIRALGIFGVTFVSIYLISKNSVKWPAFIIDNYNFIFLGLMAIIIILNLVFIGKYENKQTFKFSLIIAAVMILLFLLFYFIN
jgi:uncharacterized membrane protein YozB (DUF420 family)